MDQHPKVSFSQPKETHFFSFAGTNVNFKGPGDEALINRQSTSNPGDFDRLMGLRSDGNCTGEGSVSTLYYHQQSIGNIKEFAPDAKLIALLRHPVDRAFSSFQYMRSKGLEPLTNFAEAIDQEQQRIDQDWHHLWHYCQMGFYSQSVAAFRNAFGHHQFKIFYYDDFSKDSSSVVQEALGFLGMQDGFMPDTSLKINRSGVARGGLVATVAGQIVKNDLLRSAFKTVIPFKAREKIRNSLLKKSDGPDQEISQRLMELYREDIDALRELDSQVPDSWLSS